MPDAPDPPRVYPRLNRRLRIAMWLAFVGGPVMIAGGAYQYYRTSSLKSLGITIPGQLVDSSTLATGKGRTSYRITLDYKPRAEAVTYRKEFFVTESVYKQTRETGQASVTYLPHDPTVSAAGNDIPVQTEPIAIGGGILIFAFGVWYYLRRQSQRVELFVTGEA